MSSRTLAAALFAALVLGAAGCGDDEPTAEELPVRTVTVPETATDPLPATTPTGTTTSTTPTTTEPQDTGGASPSLPPAATTPTPAPDPVTTPRGTGGVSPGGEDQEGGAGDEDPTTSPGGVVAP